MRGVSEPSTGPSRPSPRARRAGRGRLSGGRVAAIALGAIVLLAVAHTLLWNLMGSRLQAGYDAWAAARRAQGWRIEHEAPQRAGWPLSATLRLPEFRFSGGGATVPGGIDWSARTVVLRVALHRPGELRVSAGGPQRLRVGEAEIPFAADRLTARLPLQANVPPKGGEFEALRLRIGTAAGGMEVGAAALRWLFRTGFRRPN